MEWQAKVRLQNGDKAQVKHKNLKSCADSLMAGMKQNLHCGCMDC